jgi:hypothetical protein
MATIVTVHGTGATGPEEGERWWQRGSPFEKHIRELVESTDGDLTLQPFVWDGANSEASRRIAAANLYRAARNLETKGEKHCVVGHSHGGSIISLALLLSASEGTQLPGLVRWITVGTPFIQARKSPFLFSRIGNLAKSAYISALTFLILILLLVLSASSLKEAAMQISFSLAVFGSPFILLYAALSYFNWRTLYMHRSRALKRARKSFGDRWLGLFHADDEAIAGLESLGNIRMRIFKSSFAIPFFSFISLFMVPLGVLYCITSERLMLLAYSYLRDLVANEPDVVANGTLKGGGRDIVANIQLFIQSAAIYARRLVPDLFVGYLLIVFIPSLFFAISFLLTRIVLVSAVVMSFVLSKAFNVLTWRQIREAALGGDTLGEILITAENCPTWLSPLFPPLPIALSAEITEFANREAPISLVKYRRALNAIAFSEERDPKTVFFSEYLSWNELIHTNYYNVPRFRMLVAYAIANSEGFRPTAAFKNHPDYQLVAGWYEEIRPKTQAAG